MCYTDQYIVREHDRAPLLLSMFGTQMGVKTLSAQLMEGRPITIYEDTLNWKYVTEISREKEVLRSFGGNVANVGHKIFISLNDLKPWKGVHGSCILTYGPDVDSAKTRLFRIVNEMFDIPLRPEWTDWVWSVCEDVEILQFGENEDFQCTRYVMVPDDLEELLLEELRSGALSLARDQVRRREEQAEAP